MREPLEMSCSYLEYVHIWVCAIVKLWKSLYILTYADFEDGLALLVNHMFVKTIDAMNQCPLLYCVCIIKS